MPRLAVIALFLSVSLSAYQAPPAGNEHKHADHAGIHDRQKTEKAENSCQTIVGQQTFNCEPSDQPSKGLTANSAEPVHDWIDRLNAFSTFIVGVFTVLLFVGVIWQIKTSRKIERAWVIISPQEKSPRLGFIPELGDEVGSDQRNIFSCAIKNTGNTPARLTSAAVGL